VELCALKSPQISTGGGRELRRVWMIWEGTSPLGFRYSDEMDMGKGASEGMLTATEVACSGDFVFMRRAGKELWTKMAVPPQALLAFL